MPQQRPIIHPEHVQEFVESLFGDVEHAKRVHSLARATVGVIHASSLIVHAMGRGLASVLDLDPKHATKQIDRLYVIGEREEVVVAMDWTEFDKDS